MNKRDKRKSTGGTRRSFLKAVGAGAASLSAAGAAPAAAAMSAKKGCLPRDLKVAQLQDALRADGVDLTRGGESQDKLKS